MLPISRRNNLPRPRTSLVIAVTLTASLMVAPLAATKRDGPRNEKQVVSQTNLPVPADVASELTTNAAQTQHAYGKLALQFEANQGQTDKRVKFITRAGGATVFLTPTEAVLVLSARGKRSTGIEHDGVSPLENEDRKLPAPGKQHALWMKIEGASEAAQVEGVDKLPGIVNYFIGDDPNKWRANIPTYGRVRYTEIYKGIDLVYYGSAERQLEYDFVVKPGANASQVALSFAGSESLHVDAATGDLLIKTPVGLVRQHKPLVYQEVEGGRREIESGYEIKAVNRIGFRLGAYDPSKQLVIDPVLVYSTYLGGSQDDSGNGIAVDSAGNAYVTGETASTNFPTAQALDDSSNGFEDVFVTKLNVAGSALVYSTYLGGSTSDSGLGIALDSAGNAYLTGITRSTDFPMVNALDNSRGGASDVFVSKLNAAGSALLYSTYLGGAGNESGRGIAVDPAGNPYVTGATFSSDFPTVNAIQSTFGGGNCPNVASPCPDAFVTKLNAAGSAFVYSTYLGGSDVEVAHGIAVDSVGSVYLTGETRSTNFPTVNAFRSVFGGFDVAAGGDAFVTKINAAGSALSYSTYLGGSKGEVGRGIAVDAAGSAYITGNTNSLNFPAQNGMDGSFNLGPGDAFVTKFSDSGSLAYSTYLGGSGNDLGLGIAVDSLRNAYVVGRTSSTDFPTVNAIDSTNGGTTQDAIVTKLNAAGSAITYSTYLGGSFGDDGRAIVADSAGNAYVTGRTASLDFPIGPGALQTTLEGIGSAFVSKIGNYLISGRVVDSSGNGLASVTVTLSGSDSATRQTDASGNFSFIKTTLGGEYNVTPFKAGFTFAPDTIHIFNLDSNRELLFIGSGSTTAATSIQFEFDQYVFPEDCGQASVAVIRIGDTAGALTADYVTSDATAQQKGDYTLSLGTLSFAAGETTKTISIPITEDAFREGDESFTVNLFNLSGSATLEEPARATVTIVDDDPSGTTINPIDDSEIFVCQHYHDFLGREPDTSGLLFWKNGIESCGADPGCREVKRVDTSAAFFFSIEYQETGFFAIRLQRAAFGKRSDTASTRVLYEQLTGLTRQLGDGVIVGQTGWDTRLEQNKQAYVAEVAASAAFVERFPTSLSAAQYVDALYASAEVTPTAAEQTDAITAFGGGEIAGRVAALRKVSESSSVRAAELNAAFVLLQYHGYLRRNPTDLPDTNDGGYQFWLAKLNSFNGDFRKAELVKAFLNSMEYRQRFGP